MYKIKSVKYKKHPILGNLALDFCDLSGNPVDTVIIAGENGTGKSAVLESLFRAVCFNGSEELELTVNLDSIDRTLTYSRQRDITYINDGNGLNIYNTAPAVKQKYPFKAIFSDVDINFKSSEIQTVTASELDKDVSNHRSTTDLPTQIKQLIVDIQAIDDSETAESYRKAVESGKREISSITPGDRMRRFTSTFNRMFEGLTYDRVENRNNNKSIIFKKGNIEFTIDSLSSGEKQIVYRGCFLLRDANAIKGAFVFLDEPEISLHPKWQKKILDYYKGIFTDSNGIQTSQIFVVTHSPFIIHNDERKNDKVIVLKRDSLDNIIVHDKPEYYQCDSTVPIQDAFNIDDFNADIEKSIVYLEGRTDEKYFNKALEVFGYNNISDVGNANDVAGNAGNNGEIGETAKSGDGNIGFEFQWIGHLRKDGNEEFTGASSLSHTISFIKGRKPSIPQIFLYDCDTKKQEADDGNIVVMCMPMFKRKCMNKGIENALELDTIEEKLSEFYETHTISKDYGEKTITTTLDKMKLCNYICDMDSASQKKIFVNLKSVIDRIIDRVTRVTVNTEPLKTLKADVASNVQNEGERK